MIPGKDAKVTLIRNDILKPHEDVDEAYLRELKEVILRDGKIIKPIVVDSSTKVILDGHHRHQVTLDLGLKLIPALLVNYSSYKVDVRSWRKNINVTKREVVRRGMEKDFYPCKTSRHILNFNIPSLNVSLEYLRCQYEAGDKDGFKVRRYPRNVV